MSREGDTSRFLCDLEDEEREYENFDLGLPFPSWYGIFLHGVRPRVWPLAVVPSIVFASATETLHRPPLVWVVVRALVLVQLLVFSSVDLGCFYAISVWVAVQMIMVIPFIIFSSVNFEFGNSFLVRARVRPLVIVPLLVFSSIVLGNFLAYWYERPLLIFSSVTSVDTDRGWYERRYDRAWPYHSSSSLYKAENKDVFFRIFLRTWKVSLTTKWSVFIEKFYRVLVPHR